MDAEMESEASEPAQYGEVEILLAGHSHTIALGVPKPHAEISSCVVIREGKIRILGFVSRRGLNFGDGYWDDLRAIAAGRHIVLSWMGNQHNSAFLFVNGPPFDVMAEEDTVVQPGFPLVPVSVIRACFAASLTPLPQIIHSLHHAGATRVSLLGTPPPKGDPAALLAGIRRSDKFMRLAAKARMDPSDPAAITPAPVRLHLWQVLQAALRELALAEGAGFLPVPSTMQDAEGMLRPEFSAADVTHANAAYGRRVLDAIVEAELARRSG